jgi:hypothetical protein
MPDNVISCIGNQLVDYSFKCSDDPECSDDQGEFKCSDDPGEELRQVTPRPWLLFPLPGLGFSSLATAEGPQGRVANVTLWQEGSQSSPSALICGRHRCSGSAAGRRSPRRLACCIRVRGHKP